MSIRTDRDAHRVWADGREVALRLQEYRALLYLIDNVYTVQSHARIADAMGGDIMCDGRTPTADRVAGVVGRLRRKLGPMEAARIVSVRGVGYRLDIGREHMADIVPLQLDGKSHARAGMKVPYRPSDGHPWRRPVVIR